MKRNEVLQALEKLKKDSKKRNFSQSIDIIFTLKDLNLKDPDEQVDFFVTLHHPVNKKRFVCAFVGPELADETKKIFDETVTANKFAEFKDKKKLKILAKKYDYFVAQGSLMAQVAKTFGSALGPRGKMPNPKVGAIVATKPQIKPLYDKLQNTVHLMAKKEPTIHALVGKDNQPVEEVLDNIMYVYDQLIHHLPKEKNNINNIYVKLTMSKPVKL